MNLGLEGRRVLLLGAGRGLGAASALSLAREGASVFLVARTRADVEARAAECLSAGAKVAAAIVADATNSPDLGRAFAEAGALDALVTLVGGGVPGGALDADFDAAFDRNFRPALQASRLAVKAGAKVILHVASIWGREGGGTIAYNAAKAALISLAHEQNRELASKGVRVLSVAPGSILHPGGSWEKRVAADPQGMADFVRREIPMGRFGTAQEVGDVICFLLSPRANWIAGSCITVDGGQSRSF